MNEKEFIEEVKNSTEYYAEFEKQYEEFRQYQKKAANTLQAIHEVCEKNKINYQIAFGSLLGAIRDGGQIPWDYDIDILMPVSERKKFIVALRKDLNKEYYFYSIEENKECEHVILRVAPNGYDSHYLHVDVFFMTGLPNNNYKAKKLKKQIVNTTLLYKAKKYNFKHCKADSKKEIWNMFIYKIKGIFYSSSQIFEKYQKLSEKYKIEDSKKCCCADRFAEWYDLPSNMVFDTILYKTEMGEFRIPKNYEKVLSIEYGDYMSIPPLKDRMNELKQHYKFLVESSISVDKCGIK